LSSSTDFNLSSLGEALEGIEALFVDGEVLRSLTQHLTAREMTYFVHLFAAAGATDAAERVQREIIHGDEDVRAVATPTGPGAVRIDYYVDFCQIGDESTPFHTCTFDNGGLRAAMASLGLDVDRDTLHWAAETMPGRIVLDSAQRY